MPACSAVRRSFPKRSGGVAGIGCIDEDVVAHTNQPIGRGDGDGRRLGVKGIGWDDQDEG